ncbi:Integral membrane protein (plasmid) [Paraburkholderia caribensis MBA4]|uniref:Integral membrane protein n=1 Tax=Paraburkholderia caribensis MBA4 TaxID=1323664 RepID=A0A0P0RRA8_9BURK|nr:DMT family transporter [Paraburkholderia caribensis]ALL71721.1 Integral membrane protein [Paraburkholderia caribensis MBA4]
MSIDVMLLVLFAALLHASWNAVVKSSPDKFLDIVFVTSSAAAFCLAALPFLPLPAASSWPYIAASGVIHIFYFVLIGAAYRSGDMGHAYPLMRGAPPLLVALASGPIIGERLTMGEWSGILLICAGILGLLFVAPAGGSTARTSRFALMNAVTVAAYTLVDGTGVRMSGHPASYTMWMFALTAPPILVWAVARRGADARRHLRARWHLVLIGGACTLVAYALVLWAMTRAPIAMVAALRESAILFGTAISVLFLKERSGYGRSIAAVVILSGVVTLKLT